MPAAAPAPVPAAAPAQPTTPVTRRRLDLRLGIDVGGTNTDAVVLDREDHLQAKAKAPTTPDVSSGIEAAVDAVLEAGHIDRSRISHAMLGTTHATNAVLERRRLHRVAVLRIGAPATLSVRPLLTWPAELREVVSGGETVVRGGIELDGREIVPFDATAVRDFLVPLRGKVDAVAITSVFAPVSSRHELAAAEVAREVMGDDIHLSLSHEIGALGILERENSTVLNGALLGVAREVAGTLREALARRGIGAALYFAQNDGTLMALEHALRFPVLTIGSGPANSLRGAAYLTGRDEGIVIDVGGTSTDIGVLVGGFPRESSQAVEIGGIRTNFRMPDIVSIAIGGGTIVRPGAVGPDSVAWRIQREALAFGGSTPTLTDAALMAGRARDIGSHVPASHHADLLAEGLARSDARRDRGHRPCQDVARSRPPHRGRGWQHHPARAPRGRQRDPAAARPRRGQRHRRRHRQGQRQRRGGRLVPGAGTRGGRGGDRGSSGRGRRGGRRRCRAGDGGGRGGDAAHVPHGARRTHPRQGRRPAGDGLRGQARSLVREAPRGASSSRGRARKRRVRRALVTQQRQHEGGARTMEPRDRARRAAGGRLVALLMATGLLLSTAIGAVAQDAPVTFTYGSHTEIVTDLDPATSYSNEVIAMHNVYESLTRYDSASGTLEPALATDWTVSEDGLTWTFTLRDGVTFHTGRPMDAAAAKAAIERTQSLGMGAGYIWGPVESIEAPDATTLVFQLSYPAPLDLIAAANYAAYIYDTQAAGEGASEEDLVAWFGAGQDAGTGPLHDRRLGGRGRVRADAHGLPGVLGRLGRRSLHGGRVSLRARAHDGRPAGAGW